MDETQIKLHVRFHFKSRENFHVLQKNTSIEFLYSSLRKIEDKNILIDAYIPARLLDELKNKYSIRLIGNVNETMAEACSYVSKTNRYKNQ